MTELSPGNNQLINILGTIDDKIENLEEIIKLLENNIQLNFYKRFILRQNEFDIVNLSDVFVFQEGPGIRNWQYVDNGINFINIRCIQNNDIETRNMNKISVDEAYGIYSHFLLDPLDIVVSTSGTLGRYAIVREDHLPLCLNTSVVRFKPLSFDYYSFMYSYLTSNIFKEKLEGMANGSAQLNFGPTHLKQIKIFLPPEDQIIKYQKDNFYKIQKICNLRVQIKKLNELKQLYLKKFFG